MAANKDKITAADIFDQGIKGSYEQFILLNKQAAKSVTDLKREIIKMNNAMKKGGSTLSNRKAVTTATNKQAQATKKLTAETKKLTNAKRNLNTQSKTMSGWFGKLGGGIQNLLGAVGFAGLTVGLVNVVKSMYNTTKALESIDLAMSKVTDSAYEMGRAQRYLLETSDRLGLSLIKTSKRYTTFLAAAKQSNLTMGETNEIFETFADVGANLALTSDEMGGIFLALEQMLSKGKISTEELRRQLGERLPGAFGIMAEAVGVTTGELDDMLRKGELLTEEYLPKFAKQVEITFGVDKTKKVETLAAAQERLTLEWTKFVASMSEDGEGAGKAFTQLIDKLTYLIELLKYANESGAFSNIVTVFKEISDFYDSSFIGRLTNFVKDRALGKKGDYDESKAAYDEVDKYSKGFDAMIKKYDELLEKTGEERNSAFLTAVGEQFENGIDLTDQYYDAFDKMLKDIEKKEKEEEEDDEDEEKRYAVKAIEARMEGIREVMPKLEQLLREETAKLEKTAQELKNQLQLYPNDVEAKKELDAIEKTLKGFYSRLAQIQSGNFFEPINILKRSPTYQEPKSIHETESYFKKRDAGEKDPVTGKITGEVTGLQATSENINKSLKIAQEAYGYIADLENAQFERRMEQLEEETNAINEKYDTLERLALGDEELTAKLAIRREEALALQAKKEKKIEYDAAKAKKKQSAIDAALNIALAITSALTAPPPANWIGAGVAAALGAIQLATIAATPLPAYADGTDNHPGGLAMLGDGGKNEIALHPDGTVYMSGDTPEVVDMPKGSKVMSDAKDYINQQVIKAIIDTDNKMDEIIVDKITEAVHKGFKSVKINNNNINNNNLDFQMWRHTLLN